MVLSEITIINFEIFIAKRNNKFRKENHYKMASFPLNLI